MLRVLQFYYKVASSQLPAPQIAPRTEVVLQSRQFSASCSTACSAYCSCITNSPVLSFQLHRLLCVLKLYYKAPAFRALNTHDLRRRLRRSGSSRTLACISRTRHARSPQRVAPDRVKSQSRLHFARSTRAISAEGCAARGQIALSPAFPRARHAQSPQRVAPDRIKSHSRLHFAHSTRTISAEGCDGQTQIALSLAFGVRGGPAALPPALREKVKRARGEDVSCRCEDVKMSRDDVSCRCEDEQR